MAGVARCFDKHGSWPTWHSKKSEKIHRPACKSVPFNTRMNSQRLKCLHQAFSGRSTNRHPAWKMFALPVSLDDEPSSSSQKDYSGDNDEDALDDSSESLPTLLDSDQLQSLIADSERSKFTGKLSEANQHNRFLKRQLQEKEDALVKFKRELAVMELEIQAMVKLAEEVAKSGIQPDSRKINGKYVQSHLLSRLVAVHEKVKEQIKDVDIIQSKEVSLFWCGMAESVQVMGSFDGWSQGEYLSQEYTGSFSKFSTTLMLRPGRYEIKFLVDGEWQLSPEFPTVGEGMLENNLLVVE